MSHPIYFQPLPELATTGILPSGAESLLEHHCAMLPNAGLPFYNALGNDAGSLIRDLAEKERLVCQSILQSMLAMAPQVALSLPPVSAIDCNRIAFSSTNDQSPSPPSQGITPPDTPTSSCSQEADFDRTRPHLCTICGKRFRFKSNLFEHKSLHQETQNQFSCPFCSKTCRLKGNLKKHLQIHVNTAEDLERLWKERFSRSSGRPRKFPAPESR